MQLPEPHKAKWSRSEKLALASVAIALISLLATLFMTWFAAQISIDVTKRLNSHPEIRIQKDNITFHWDSNGMPQRYDSDRSIVSDESENWITIPSLYLNNVGNDVALDVEIDWMLIENLERFSQLSNMKTEVLQRHADGSIEIALQLGSNEEHRISEQPKSRTSYLRANSESPSSFPLTLLKSIAFYCYRSFPQDSSSIDNSRTFRETTMPVLHLKASYENALGELTEEALAIEFRIIHFERNPDRSGCCSFEISAFRAQ